MNTSDVLLKAEVKEVPLEECRYNYTFPIAVSLVKDSIYETHLCAKNKLKHQDACGGLKDLFRLYFTTTFLLGDSGSGLVFEYNETYFVAGIVSFGLSCFTPVPALYTRVYKYLDWIEEIVWPHL